MMNEKPGLHPRNKHKSGYDFSELIKIFPKLAPFVAKNKFNTDSINFSDPEAVLALNAALLKYYYEVKFWDLPKGYLCPPIPGRADAVHHLADLLKPENGEIPRGPGVRILDVGVGANCVYPLIAHQEYGWSVTGSEVDEIAVKNAQQIVDKNNLNGAISIIQQKDPAKIFDNIIAPGDFFQLTICNPPFHASALEASEASDRKNRNLGFKKSTHNFGGQNSELWCEGGEKAFILKMINESVNYKKNVNWFSSLVSKSETLPFLYEEFKKLNIRKFRTIDLSHGQKKSRIIAWTLF